jgi:hypothetical protein
MSRYSKIVGVTLAVLALTALGSAGAFARGGGGGGGHAGGGGGHFGGGAHFGAAHIGGGGGAIGFRSGHLNSARFAAGGPNFGRFAGGRYGSNFGPHFVRHFAGIAAALAGGAYYGVYPGYYDEPYDDGAYDYTDGSEGTCMLVRQPVLTIYGPGWQLVPVCYGY